MRPASTGGSPTGPAAASYEHWGAEALIRPEVGVQSRFKKRRAPAKYSYDPSLAPTMQWDSGNPARERGEALIARIQRAAQLLASQGASVDGLKGMPEALGTVFPQTTLQTCIVHLIRNSLDFASWKDRKALAAAIKPIYTAPSAEAAQAELAAFEQGDWGQKFPTVVAAWRRAWDRVIPFFAFPSAVRRVIYTTNAIESVNARLRKIIKTRGHFPSDDAANKLIWLALRNITADWSRASRDWKDAMNQFAILYAERFTRPNP